MAATAFAPLSIALAAGSGTGPGPEDYTQWRGQHGDGSASAFIEPAQWPDELRLVWRVEVGEGYATPLAVGDSVYVFVRRQEREVMRSLDASTGEELWSAGYPAPYSPAQPAAAHGAGPKATPSFRDGRLFTLGISGIVAAFDASDGTLLWRTEAPAEPPYFGAASSPVAGPGTVIAHPGDYGPLTAFGRSHGRKQVDRGRRGLLRLPGPR